MTYMFILKCALKLVLKNILDSCVLTDLLTRLRLISCMKRLNVVCQVVQRQGQVASCFRQINESPFPIKRGEYLD